MKKGLKFYICVNYYQEKYRLLYVKPVKDLNFGKRL